jgi:chemotaxis protein methyltransferase CheR
MEINPSALRTLSSILEERTGQRLNEGRQWRVELALRPILKLHDIASCESLAARLMEPGSDSLRDETVDALLNNETYFFRDTDAFSTLPQIIEAIAGHRENTKKLKIWSAGCSTGQEIYSLAMQFREDRRRWDGWTLDLLGTDISRKAIARGQEAVYSQFEIQRGLPAKHMLQWFEQRGERWHAHDDLRRMVHFRRQNILEAPPPGLFDLILCRNVLLYFPAANRGKALDWMSRALAPDGALMLGAGETVLGYCDRFEILPGARSLYRLAPPEKRQLAIGA